MVDIPVSIFEAGFFGFTSFKASLFAWMMSNFFSRLTLGLQTIEKEQKFKIF